MVQVMDASSYRKNDGSQAVQRALRILSAFLDHTGSYLSLSELARYCQLSPSTTHRLVHAFVNAGYITQDSETARYCLGAKVRQLGNKAMRDLDLGQRALPPMRKLAETVQASVNLGMLYNESAIYVQKVESPQALQLNLPIGTLMPLYSCAIGKVLLSSLPDDARQQLISRIQLEQLQSNTITDPQVLAKHLDIVRQQGYAIDDEEVLAGVICLGAPIRMDGEIVAALAIQFPKVHLKTGDILDYLPDLLETVSAIETTLGK